MKTRMKKTKLKVLPPVRASLAQEVEYRRRLQALVDEMHCSVLYWLSASYKRNEPEIAQDELPAEALRKALRKLSRQWQQNFNDAAPRLARYFATAQKRRSERLLYKILADAGIAVKFTMTRAMRDVLRASLNEQVSLIKSIPQKYLTQVEGAVMRSVSAGRDLASLTREINEEYGVTMRRAAFIARDQSNKSTAIITRTRQLEAGIKQAIWVHSTAGKTPRPTHLAAGRRRQRYDIAKGWFDPHEQKRILPGELPNCRCTARAVVRGFS